MTIDPVSENGTGTAQVNCFTRGTRIRTRRGEVVVEALAVGDALLCTDGLYRPLRWIGRRLLSARELRAAPHLRPVELAQDALGPGKPEAPLALSPQHRVLLTGWRCELYFAEAEVLAPVKALVNDSTITRVTEERAVEYFHLLLDEHQVIYANGLECETLMPAELMREAMPPEGRAEICEIFPELAADFGHYGPLRHRALRSHEARVLLG
ncbi:MAG: Hint domain-containing protein [Roseovarius sp.]